MEAPDYDLVRQETLDKLDLLSEEQLATMLSLKVLTLRRWREMDEGPNWVKLGQRVFYRRADVKEWVDRCVGGPRGQNETEAEAA